MVPPEFRRSIQVVRLHDDDGPTLARVAVERAHVDLFGQPVTFTVNAAGVAWDAETAVDRCWYETVERVQASAPATVARVVARQPASLTMPWWAFTRTPDAARGPAEASNPLEGAYACTAVGLVSGHGYWVPASRVIPYWGLYTAGQGVAGECDGSGLAAAPPGELAAAVGRGLREVLERDAIMLAWHGGGPSAVIAVDPVRYLRARAVRWLASAGLTVELFSVGRRGLDPVVVALTDDGTGTVAGSACARSLGAAAGKALLESLMILNTVTELASAGYRRPATAHDITSSLGHVTYAYGNPGVFDRWRAEAQGTRGAEASTPWGTGLAQRVHESLGVEPLLVRLVPTCGLPEVVRVLVPGAWRKESTHAGAAPHPFG